MVAIGLRAAVQASRGALDVGVGLGVLGLSSYGFLALAARSVPPVAFANLSVLYVLVYTVGPGLFSPLELEIARGLAHRQARGEGGGPLLRKALTAGLALGALLLAVAGAVEPLVASRLFDGSTLLYAGLLISVVALLAAHVSRGALAGAHRFSAYGVQLGIEGVVRMAACAALVLIPVHAVGPYGLALGAAILLSVLLTGPHPRVLAGAGPSASWAELSGALGWLLAGSVLSQILINASVVIAKLLTTAHDRAAAGRLLTALVLARLPMFLFTAVQVVLLPRLAAHVGAGDQRAFVKGLLRLLVGIAVVTAVTAVAAWVAGPLILRVMFGARYAVAPLVLVALTSASCVYMAATVLSQSLIAMQKYARAAAGWAVGVVAFAAIVAVGQSVIVRVAVGFLGGTVVAAVALGVLARGPAVKIRPATGVDAAAEMALPALTD